MPFQSEAQRRLFWAKVDKGEISKAKAMEWEKETPNKKLPMHKNNKKIAALVAGTTRLQPNALTAALNKIKKPPAAAGSGVQARPPLPSHVETQKARYLARTSGGPASAMDLGRTSVACEIAAYKDLFEK